ncbi:hypothetical protein GQ44DRAFT_784152 [Phaeosphaeriaceae sp. PMI808]|nr:hypothetical protein GQ44DRAFT_784152 [Phaeosphaeriaceae sp. PMI808]
MFRKGKEILSKKYTEDSQSFDDDESLYSATLVPTNSSSRPIAQRKRASEPAIFSYRTSTPSSDVNSRLQRFGSDAVVPKKVDTASTNALTAGPNPLGLSLIHTIPEPLLDLIFVHGLGGSSFGTWSWNHDPNNFWPSWFEDDLELARTRIFTFGYNSAFREEDTALNVTDFALDLLLRMKTFSDDSRSDYGGSIAIGQLPIVFVAHSMGGLVVKKAYILGSTKQQYTDLAAQTKAMVFLATPHRGSAYAQTLQNILKSVPGFSGKSYVEELVRNSGTLQDINEQFRNICESLLLVSFHETAKTGPIRKLIVEKDSAQLGYPGEITSSLNADHHTISKFESRLDSNYTNVKNILKYIMKEVMEKLPVQALQTSMQNLVLPHPAATKQGFTRERLLKALGLPGTFDEDFEYLATKASKGSCRWILNRHSLQQWMASSPESSNVLWLTGNPGSGKSTIASFIIQEINCRPYIGTCQYHFFLYADQARRSLSYLLRSLALQVALVHEPFCTQLLRFCENIGVDIKEQKPAILWEKIFEELIKYLSKIKSASQVKILLLSRPRKDLTKEIGEYFPTVRPEVISADDTLSDIREYVRSNLSRILPKDPKAQSEILRDILSKSAGSFLWVKLALSRIMQNWYLKEDIKAAIDEIPEGMEPLYVGMIENIAKQPEKSCRIASRVLCWVACSFRPLDVAELEEALRSEFAGFVNLELTVEEICGLFVVVNNGKVILIHHTARQFLLTRTKGLAISIEEHETHEHLSSICIDYLSDATRWRRTFSALQNAQQVNRSLSGAAVFSESPFLFYALSFWAYHVGHSLVNSDDTTSRVLTFLEENFLTWVHGIALSKDFRIMARVAQFLKAYVKRKTAYAQRRLQHLSLNRDGELRQWADDIIRIVSRFGSNLAGNPSSVYRHMVPFCPKDSIVSRTFLHENQSSLQVSGLSHNTWSDCVAKLTMGEYQTALKIRCKDNFILTLVGVDGTIIVWDADTCQEARRFVHGEYVTELTSSRTSNLVATAGFETTKVWDISTGEQLYCLPKDQHHTTKSIAFGAKDEEILIAYDDCEVQCVNLQTKSKTWRFLCKSTLAADHNCPRYMSFSPDLSQIALVFRGRPVVVWTIQPDVDPSSLSFIPPKRCVLAEDRLRTVAEGDAWDPPEIAIWHPGTGHLLILYEDTRLVDWNIADDEHTKYSHTAARAMVLNSDGTLLLTSDVHGTLSIWTVPGYRLSYQLKFDELITDLAFAPDSTRFYDIRGTFCNVWEPEALVRPTEMDRDDVSSYESSNYDSIVSDPVFSNDEVGRVPITAIAFDSLDQFYCCGKEDGTVTIHTIPGGERSRKVTSHSPSTSITKIGWSPSSNFLVSVDDSGRIIAKRLEPSTKEGNRWAVFPSFDIRIDNSETVQDFIFHPKEQYLLIVTITTAYVMTLNQKKKEKHVCRTTYPKGAVWLNHPTDPALVLRIESDKQFPCFWKTLQPASEVILQPEVSNTLNPFFGSSTRIARAIQARDYVLLETTTQSRSNVFDKPTRGYALLDLRKIQTAQSTCKQYNISNLSNHVRCLIGSIHDQIVFLDHQFWLCTWDVEAVYTNHKRHFFLPQDWISPTSLTMMCTNAHRTLLVPKNETVAIIRGGFKA